MAHGNTKWPSDHRFNYENTKRAFFQEVEYVIQQKKLHKKILRKRDDIDIVIHNFIEHNRDHRAYFTSNCTVVNENGRHVLGNCTQSYHVVKMKQIISIEEMFDLLYELHVYKPHLEKRDIIELVNNKCVLRETFIHLFWRSCETCCRIVKNLDLILKFKRLVEVAIFNMNPNDGNFTNILMYLEKNTNFVLLRPLSYNFSYAELAYELFAIFTDFGITQLCSSNIASVLRNDVTKILRTLELPFKVPPILTQEDNFKSELLIPRIQALLTEWMESRQSTNWAIGTHIVQWKLNTNKPLETYSYIRSKVVKGPLHSPFHAMFGFLPATDIVKIEDKRPQNPEENAEKDLVVCSQCKDPIYKVLQCNFCQQPCHFYCCYRYLEKLELTYSYIKTVCLSCSNTNMTEDEETILGT